MKVIYFERREKSPLHIHAGSYACIFYIPDKEVVLYSEQHGTFGATDFSITTNERTLKEAKKIMKGKVPNLDNVVYSNIREFDYNDSKLQTLVKDAKLKVGLEQKVKSGINDLLKYAGKNLDIIKFGRRGDQDEI